MKQTLYSICRWTENKSKLRFCNSFYRLEHLGVITIYFDLKSQANVANQLKRRSQ